MHFQVKSGVISNRCGVSEKQNKRWKEWRWNCDQSRRHGKVNHNLQNLQCREKYARPLPQRERESQHVNWCSGPTVGQNRPQSKHMFWRMLAAPVIGSQQHRLPPVSAEEWRGEKKSLTQKRKWNCRTELHSMKKRNRSRMNEENIILAALLSYDINVP